jgi:hypothetical protein
LAAGVLVLSNPHHNNLSIPPGPHSTSVFTGVLLFGWGDHMVAFASLAALNTQWRLIYIVEGVRSKEPPH